MWNISIWPIDKTLSGVTTLGQSGPGSDGNEGVLRITQSPSINEAPPIRLFIVICRISVSYPSIEMQWVYSTAQAEWVKNR